VVALSKEMSRRKKTTDFETTKQRSANMRAIRGTSNASTEWRFRSLLARNAVTGWRLHEHSVLGVPDFFFAKPSLAVFIDGCFWHGCPNCGHVPKSNKSYWIKKLARNRNRDRQINRELKRGGVKVLRIWECSLRKQPDTCLKKLLGALTNQRP
jgi:DNA mismatch endonuclease Vsr